MAEAQSKRSVKKTNEYKQEQNRTPRKKGKGKRKEKKRNEGGIGGGRRRGVCALPLCKESEYRNKGVR
jgi:hypothetical protein